jgi:hypothetical protein
MMTPEGDIGLIDDVSKRARLPAQSRRRCAVTDEGRAAVTYWRKGMPSQNFGDYLSEMLYEALCGRSRRTAPPHDFAQLFLIGSVISKWHITTALKAIQDDGRTKIGFWGCGMRDNTPIDPNLLARCQFMGVRGPLTREALGLPKDTPMGDPGLLMPLIYQPKTHTVHRGRTLCMPHFLDPLSKPDLLRMTGADAVVRPGIRARRHALLDTIDAIADADFVLAGALHGAIIACAYGVPFAYFDSGYVDAPFKWRDFAAVLSIPPSFVTNVASGRSLYDSQIRPALRMPSLEQLLVCAPIPAPADLLRLARARDDTKTGIGTRNCRDDG